MIREEEIKLLEPGNELPPFPHTSENVDEACRMAISALRSQNHNAIGIIEGMCCDCIYGERCCDYSENKECERYKEDGSCWMPYQPAEMDRIACTALTFPGRYCRECENLSSRKIGSRIISEKGDQK